MLKNLGGFAGLTPVVDAPVVDPVVVSKFLRAIDMILVID